MTRPEFVPATRELVEAYFGGTPPFTLRGHVALLDGEPVGIGGIFYNGEIPIAFSQMKDAMRPFKRDRARAVRLLEKQFDEFKGTLYAVADPKEPTSQSLLRKLGFEPTGRTIDHGVVMVRV